MLNSPSEDRKFRMKLSLFERIGLSTVYLSMKNSNVHKRKYHPFCIKCPIGRIVSILCLYTHMQQKQEVTPSIYERLVLFLPIISYSIKRNKNLTIFEDTTTQSNYNRTACSRLFEIWALYLFILSNSKILKCS